MMKNIIFLLLILTLIISCKSNNKQPVKNSAVSVKNTDQSIALIKMFKPVLQGSWVKKAYIDKIIETRSPLAAADEANDLTTFVIDTHDIKGDSIVVPAGWGNHDGSYLTLKFIPGKRASSIVFGSGELCLSMSNGVTILTFYRPDDKTNRIDANQYIKAQSQKPSELGEGTDYLINKAVIAGNYILTDSSGTTSNITFGAHGDIKGFLNFKKYGINIDLNSDVMDNLDEIGFDYDNKNHKSYSFKIHADTLKLYDTRPNADSTLLVLDKLKYKLVRVR